MRNNFHDKDDPALISKKFWSHVKSTSNTSRILRLSTMETKFVTVLGIRLSCLTGSLLISLHPLVNLT